MLLKVLFSISAVAHQPLPETRGHGVYIAKKRNVAGMSCWKVGILEFMGFILRSTLVQ